MFSANSIATATATIARKPQRLSCKLWKKNCEIDTTLSLDCMSLVGISTAFRRVSNPVKLLKEGKSAKLNKTIHNPDGNVQASLQNVSTHAQIPRHKQPAYGQAHKHKVCLHGAYMSKCNIIFLFIPKWDWSSQV